MIDRLEPEWVGGRHEEPGLRQIVAKINELVDAANGPQPTGDPHVDLLVRLVNEGPLLVDRDEVEPANELLDEKLVEILEDGRWAINDAGRRWLAGRR